MEQDGEGPVPSVIPVAPMATTTVAITPVQPPAVPMIVTTSHGTGLVLRAIWFVSIGWWATAFLLTAAWFLSLTILFLPLAYVLFNVVPTVLTLRPRRTHVTAEMRDGVLHVTHGHAPQRQFAIRAAWFIVVGWWLSAVCILIGYVLCLTVVLIPVGVMVLNRIPEAMTLRRN